MFFICGIYGRRLVFVVEVYYGFFIFFLFNCFIILIVVWFFVDLWDFLVRGFSEFFWGFDMCVFKGY